MIYLLFSKFDKFVCADPFKISLLFFLRRNGFKPFQRYALRRGFEYEARRLVPFALVGNVLYCVQYFL